MRFSLRNKILLLIAGTVTGMTSIILAALSVLTDQEIEHSVHNDVRATGNVLKRFVSLRGEALEAQLDLLARQPALQKYTFNLIDGSGQKLQSDYETTSEYARDSLKQIRAGAALITDQDGCVLGDSDKRTPYQADISTDPGVAAALRGENWIGIVARDNRLQIQVCVPVKVGGYVKGTMTGYSAIDSSLAEELRNELGTEVAFIEQGRVVGASLEIPASIPTPQTVPVHTVIRGKNYYVLYAPFAGTTRQAGRGIVVLRPHDIVQAHYRKLQAAFLAVSVASLLLALWVGATVGHSITRPLDTLVNAARTLQKGEWPEQFGVPRHDEIGVLQRAFGEMTASLRNSQERLLALIDTDPLTDLDNHRRFHDRLEQEIRRCAVSGEALSLLLINIDHFQHFNQRYSHAEGDRALQVIASLLRDCLPEIAIAARYAGEEFAVLLPQQSLEQAEKLAEQIRNSVEQYWADNRPKRRLTVSVGCAEYGNHTGQGEGLVLAAELAVSLAKQLGRNRVCRFDSVPGAEETSNPYQLQTLLQDGNHAAIQALAAAVDAKDPYTRGHSQRVANYARALACAMALPADDIELIYVTGTLHDVGKIGVPDAILKKTGRLEESERAAMETHPVLGEVIVRKVPSLAATLPGVRHHHERWDGKGYPDRLAGENIPRMARILALADTFDAMTSDRPYRKGLAWEIALAEITKCTGAQFDPELAPIFVRMMQAQQADTPGV